MGLFDVLDDLFDDLTGIFGGDDDGEGGDEFDGPLQQALPAPPAGASPWGPAPQVPNGPSGLQQGVDHAGTTYQQASGALTQTDDKLAGLLKQIFAANDDTRSKIGAIIGSIETARRALTSDPQMANDPHAMALFNQFLDGQLAQIQQLLDSSKVEVRSRLSCLPRSVMSTATAPAEAIRRTGATQASPAVVMGAVLTPAVMAAAVAVVTAGRAEPLQVPVPSG